MDIALLEGSGNAGILNMIFIAAMIVVMYFFFLRPQKKKREELEVMRENLQKGDKVMVGGIYGKVLKIDGDEITIEIEEGKLKAHKSFVESIPVEDVPAKEDK